MDCSSCAMVIESDLEDAGINAKCDFANETLVVEIHDKSHEQKIHEIVTKSGYDLV